MFKHIFINRLKVLLRSKVMIFWTAIFPIILATFFNLAFGNIAEEEKFKPFNIAIIKNDSYEQEANFKALVETLSADGEGKMFNVQYVKNIEEANKLLDDNEIKGYIEVEKFSNTKELLNIEETNNLTESDKIKSKDNKNNIKITVKENGTVQTILKSIVDNYYQTYSMVENIAEINPQMLSNLNSLTDLENNNFEDKSSKNMDYIVVYFYTLIGMTCLYGGFFRN